VDKLAKQAVKLIHIKITLSKKEVKGKIKEFINNKWQEVWNSVTREDINGGRVFRSRK